MDTFEIGVDKAGESDVQYVYEPISTQQQLSIFDFKPAERQKVEEVRSIQRVRVSTTGNIKASGEILTGVEDAAALLSFLRRSPQEFFYSIAVDNAGRILEVHKYTKGYKSGVTVSSTEVAGCILNVSDAKKVYLAHNHPTGDVTPSPDDYRSAMEMKSLLHAGGVASQNLIVGGTNFSHLLPDSGTYSDHKIPPRIRKVAIPVKERTRLIKGSSLPPIKNAKAATEAFERHFNNDDGVMLLDRKNRPIAFVPFIKGRSMKQTTADIIRLAESSNASSFVINIKTADRAREEYADALWQGGLADLQPVDVIAGGKSWAAEKGIPNWAPGSTRYSDITQIAALELRLPDHLFVKKEKAVKSHAKALKWASDLLKRLRRL
jgi:hypothetical protein